MSFEEAANEAITRTQYNTLHHLVAYCTCFNTYQISIVVAQISPSFYAELLIADFGIGHGESIWSPC